MKQFAHMVDGRVAEVFPEFITVGEGDDAVQVPLDQRYHPDFVAQLVEFDPENPPPEPELPPAPIPSSVTMRQARLALLQAGHYGAVEQAMASLPGDQGTAARIEWEFAATVERQSPVVALLSSVVGLAVDDLDALFVAASAL